MIYRLTQKDISKVARIHSEELSGFLPQLGEEFLRKFYEIALTLPEMFIFIENKNGQVLGFVSGIESPKGLNKKIFFRDLVGFGILFMKYFITHPQNILKTIKILTYPGFRDETPELLTLGVSKKHQRKGIGTRLFKTVVEEFKKRKVEKFKISIYDNLSANRFYKKMGCELEKSFNFLGERMNYYSYELE